MALFASFVVVNFNGDAVLRRCLAALSQQTDQDFEIILVDNASAVAWEPAVPASLKAKIVVVQNNVNCGYAKGNNQGIAVSRGEWIVFVNNDATLREDFLAHLRSAASQHPEFGLFAPQVRIEDYPDYIDSAGVGVFLDGVARNRGWQDHSREHQEPVEVLGMVGAVAAIHRKVWTDVSGFDEDFFMYLEDSEWGLRAAWRGHRCLYLPQLMAWHKHSSTTGKHTAEKAYWVERNHLWCAVKNFPLPLLLLSPFYTCYRYVLQACAAATNRGITSAFMRSYTRAELARVLWRAYRDAILGLPAMWRKRREIMRGRRLTTLEFLLRFRRYRLSWRDFAFKD